ncbi:MAG: DUF4013 domain-containing protein [Methanobrevibacter sp.]|jgi:hypothetical protein|nr:DUF4013 domain-containing protein [Candidatus Methanoflexus mossambicus]
MSLRGIFSDSFKYPLMDLKGFLILGVLMIISSITSFYDFGTIINEILFIVTLIISFIILGYILSVIRETINDNDDDNKENKDNNNLNNNDINLFNRKNSGNIGENINNDENNSDSKFDYIAEEKKFRESIYGKKIEILLPKIAIKKNLSDGIKYFLVELIYFIIPLIIISFVAIKMNIVEIFNKFLVYYNQYGVNFQNHIPEDFLLSVGFVFMKLFALVVVLIFIFKIVETIAICRLAKYNSFKSAFQLKQIFSDIGKISWRKYISFLILLFIFSYVFLIASALIMSTGVSGIVVSIFLVSTYSSLFNARASGLIYKERDNNELLNKDYSFNN